MLDGFILAAPVEDLGKDITILAIVHNDVSEIFPFDDATERDRVCGDGSRVSGDRTAPRVLVASSMVSTLERVALWPLP